MHSRVLILGAGFAGMELASLLSEAFGEAAHVTLIERGEAFVFGYAKLDVMFGRKAPAEVRLPWTRFRKPGVRFCREDVQAIDPETRRVTTDAGVHTADHLVVALGADYDLAATPGLDRSTEFYSVAGAENLARLLPGFAGGDVVVGVAAAPFKCPPAPSEAALMMHDYLVERGIRDRSRISVVMPFATPVPPSPDTSQALLQAFSERGINWIPGRRLASVDAAGGKVMLDDGRELACDLLLGVPRHKAPAVVEKAGMAEDGWVPVDPRSMRTRWPGVFAAGDIASTGTPKAGVFAEGEARAIAATLINFRRGSDGEGAYDGRGTCYFEFGAGRIAKVEVDFLSGPKPSGIFHAPSGALRQEKEDFGSSRRARWFGM